MEAYIKGSPYFEELVTYVREGRFPSLRSAVRAALVYEANFYVKMKKMEPFDPTERSAALLERLIIADGRDVNPQQKKNMSFVAVRHFVRDDIKASNMRKKEERKPFWDSYIERKKGTLTRGVPSRNIVSETPQS